MDKIYMYLDTKKGMFTLSPFRANFRISSTIKMYEMPGNISAAEISAFVNSGQKTDSGWEYKETKTIKLSV